LSITLKQNTRKEVRSNDRRTERESFFDALARGLGSAMRRRLTALLAMVVMALMLVAGPAFADKGGSHMKALAVSVGKVRRRP